MEKTIDARTINAQERHATIFRMFDELGVGDSFQLVNGHDPVPLKMQFEQLRPEQFTWDYEAQGPDLWKIKIARVKNGPSPKFGDCGCCGGH